MHARVESIGRDLHQLFPVDPSGLARMRSIAEAGFNSIDPRESERAEAEPLMRKFAELNQSSARLADRVDAFRDNQTRYLTTRQTLTSTVARSSNACANTVRRRSRIRSSAVRSRCSNAASAAATPDLDQIEAHHDRLAAGAQIKTPADQTALLDLIETMRALVPVRRAVETNLTDIVGGRFQRQVMNLRELIHARHVVPADHHQRLARAAERLHRAAVDWCSVTSASGCSAAIAR